MAATFRLVANLFPVASETSRSPANPARLAAHEMAKAKVGNDAATHLELGREVPRKGLAGKAG